MPSQLPFAPQSINATRVLPKQTLTSVFTGASQEIVSDFPYWRGDILFPPMQGDRVNQWREWLAKLQASDDPTIWIPVDFEKINNDDDWLLLEDIEQSIPEFGINVQPNNSERQGVYDEFRVNLVYPDGAPGLERLALRESFAAFREKYFKVGSLLQLRNYNNEDVSFIKVVMDCGFADAGTIFYVCLDRETPYDLDDVVKFYNYFVYYGRPKVRAQLLGSDNMSLAYDRDRVSHPLRIEWQEALGYINRDIRESGL